MTDSTKEEMLSFKLVSRTLRTPRQTTHYLQCGSANGPLMIFIHGWPSISLMWRSQMNAFAADGWHCVAPDLRGYGQSFAPAANDAYAIAEVVADMTELHDHLGGKAAIWVAHDWGCVVASSLAVFEPGRSRGLVLTSLAYQPGGHSLHEDYYRFYTTHFKVAVADLDADKAASLASVFQPGNPATVGTASPNAMVTRNEGRFGAAHRAPPTKPDPTLWPPQDFEILVQSFESQGFRPACAWYLNDDINVAYARTAPEGGQLSQPVLFINGDFDQICSIVGNRQGDPMQATCADLTVTSLPAGHWLPLERKAEHIHAIRTWLQKNSL